MKDLHRKVKLAITSKNIKLVQLSKATGISNITISRYFNGTNDLTSSKLIKILNYIGIDIEKILEEKILMKSHSSPDSISSVLSSLDIVERKLLIKMLIQVTKNNNDFNDYYKKLLGEHKYAN